MAKEKRMNQTDFEKIAKDLTAFAEIIRAKQDQKQTMINDFAKERKRYHSGKISKKALAASVPRVRKDLQQLNNEIKKNIKNLHKVAEKTKKFAMRQSPKNFRVSLTNIKAASKKRKKSKPKKRTKK